MEIWAAHFWAGGKGGGGALTNHRPEAEGIKDAAQLRTQYLLFVPQLFNCIEFY
jgi:hypothetical protein